MNFQRFSRSLVWVVLASLALTLVGCGGPEVASKSDRPWNTPRQWEHGLPSSINEGR